MLPLSVDLQKLETDLESCQTEIRRLRKVIREQSGDLTLTQNENELIRYCRERGRIGVFHLNRMQEVFEETQKILYPDGQKDYD